MDFLTTAEVANLLRCQTKDPLRQARAWLRAHSVPFVRVGKHKIYRRGDVEAALKAALESSCNRDVAGVSHR